MGILSRVSPRFVGREVDGAKADGGEGKAPAAVMEERRKHKRTPAEDEAVAEFRRLLAEMLGESAPEESDQLEPEPEATSLQDFTETTAVTFALGPSEAAEVTDIATDSSTDDYLDGAGSASLPPGLFQEEITDDAEEDEISPASVIEGDPISQEGPTIDDEQQITPISIDRERVRIDLKDGRRIEAWRRSSPSTDRRLLILDVIAVSDPQGKDIPSTPADSFIYRSEVSSIDPSSPDNSSPNHPTPEEKERF